MADSRVVLIASIDSTFVQIVAGARAAGSVPLAHAASVAEGAIEGDTGVDFEIGLGSMSFGEEDIKVVGLPNG